MASNYDTIGARYSERRRPDPRIAARIHAALGPARSVLNVGAGSGSYEPQDRDVFALEPSWTMIQQRQPASTLSVRGRAEDLPFADHAFDASMAILTIHHWTDKAKGLQEMRRVTRGPVVLLTFDASHRGAWLLDYLPQLAQLDEAQMPAMADYAAWIGPVEITPVPVPHDCVDGFLHAFWRRPHTYLDERIRRGSSSFWAIEDAESGLAQLKADLESGVWRQRYAALLDLDEYDAGYRLLRTVAR